MQYFGPCSIMVMALLKGGDKKQGQGMRNFTLNVNVNDFEKKTINVNINVNDFLTSMSIIIDLNVNDY